MVSRYLFKQKSFFKIEGGKVQAHSNMKSQALLVMCWSDESVKSMQPRQYGILNVASCMEIAWKWFLNP